MEQHFAAKPKEGEGTQVKYNRLKFVDWKLLTKTGGLEIHKYRVSIYTLMWHTPTICKTKNHI